MSSDCSQYTIEYRILAAAWLYESDESITAVRNVKCVTDTTLNHLMRDT